MAKQNEIIIPGFIISLISGIIILFFGVAYILIIFHALSSIQTILVAKNIVYATIYFIIGMQFILGILMIIGSILIKHEKHSLAGSIIVLITGLISLIIGAGFFIGPILGIIGGIIGLKEHQKILMEGL